MVTYVQPTYEEMQRRFVNVARALFVSGWGEKKEFITDCDDVSKEAREITFEYVHIDLPYMDEDRYLWPEMVEAEMTLRGLRPALYEELLSFDMQYPDERIRHGIYALGSSVDMQNGHRGHYAFLNERGLGSDDTLFPLDETYMFLGVRE